MIYDIDFVCIRGVLDTWCLYSKKIWYEYFRAEKGDTEVAVELYLSQCGWEDWEDDPKEVSLEIFLSRCGWETFVLQDNVAVLDKESKERQKCRSSYDYFDYYFQQYQEKEHRTYYKFIDKECAQFGHTQWEAVVEELERLFKK